MENSRGYTTFVPIGLKTDFVRVDLDKQLVEAIVNYQDIKIMSVIVDIRADNIHVEGSFGEIADIVGQYGITEEETIATIRTQAEFFLQNNIVDPMNV